MNTTTNARNNATDFQMETFAQLVSDGGIRGISSALKKKLANLPPHLLVLLMQVIQDGVVDAGGKDSDAMKKLHCAGLNPEDVRNLNASLQAFLGGWTVDKGEVESFLSALGFSQLDPAKMAEVAEMFMDGSLTKNEAERMKELGLFGENDSIDGIVEATNFILANGEMNVSDVSTEGLTQLQEMGIIGNYSFGDVMLLLLILMMGLFQKRIETMSQEIANQQLATDVADHKYRTHLNDVPEDKTSNDYKLWSEEKERLKMDMDREDDEVEQMIAEMKRVMDKYDTLEKMLQGIRGGAGDEPVIARDLTKELPKELRSALRDKLETATDDTMDEVAIELAQQATSFIDRVQETLSRYETSEGDDRRVARAQLMDRLQDIQQFKAQTQQILSGMPALRARCASVLAKSQRRRPAA